MKKLWLLIVLLILGGAGFVYFSPIFEKTPPVIQIKTNGYTNLKQPLEVDIKDASGIKYYRVTAIYDNKAHVLNNQTVKNRDSELKLKVKLPQLEGKKVTIKVVAVDNSKWHFFAGNTAKKSASLLIDTTPPSAEVINNSYAIGKGGSAVVVVYVADKNLKDKYVLVNNKYKFQLTPFVKKGYYITLVAWDINDDKFDAELIAEDKAGNITQIHIPYYWRKYKYPKAKINISDKFVNTIAVRVLKKMGLSVPENPVKIFKKVNEEVRALNEKEIAKITKPVRENRVDSFNIARFNPLPGSALKAYFGEKRTYYYKNEPISKAVHKGMDLAKIRHSKIYSSNYGKVVAEKYIGIYGNVEIIYHKLGLYTLYAHTSSYVKKVNDFVKRGDIIAITGSSGAVFGDHLHFGVYIQGVAVNPKEWMDPHWIKINILNVINQAKRTIDK